MPALHEPMWTRPTIIPNATVEPNSIMVVHIQVFLMVDNVLASRLESWIGFERLSVIGVVAYLLLLGADG